MSDIGRVNLPEAGRVLSDKLNVPLVGFNGGLVLDPTAPFGG